MPVVVVPGPDEPITRDGAETWSRLRVMRSDPPGYARSDPERQRRFRAALEQSQHSYDAALTAPSDTKPVLLFYCCGQALKAWAAAGLRDRWRPNSHGLKVGGIPAPSGHLSDVTVEIQRHGKPEKQTSDFNTLRRLNGEDLIDATDTVSLGEIWGFMSSALDLPLVGSQPAFTHLNLFPYRNTDRTMPVGHDRETAYQVSTRHPLIPTESDGFRQRIVDALPLNFAEVGPRTPWPLADSLGYWGVSVPPAVLDLDLTDPPQWLAKQLEHGTVTVWARIHNRIAFRHLDLVWLVLAALADIARYEPEFWRSCMDVDQTRDSESLVAFLNYAQAHVPGMVLKGLSLLDF